MPLLTGIFGGTFDPIHNGHLAIVKSLWASQAFEHIEMIPNRQSPHRSPPIASQSERATMIQKAIAPLPYCQLNTLAFDRPAPSYAIDTLRTLKTRYPRNTFALILGEDAFRCFPHWLHWREILKLAHIILVPRQEYPHIKNCLFENRITDQWDQLQKHEAGWILQSHIQTPDISASQIRATLKQHQKSNDLPDPVMEYLTTHKLY